MTFDLPDGHRAYQVVTVEADQLGDIAKVTTIRIDVQRLGKLTKVMQTNIFRDATGLASMLGVGVDYHDPSKAAS